EQYKGYTFPLAVCIVLSGMYEDDSDNAEDIVYTGQGGHDLLGSKQQIRDQKLERVMEGCGLAILFDGEINESRTGDNDWKATLEAEVSDEIRLCSLTEGCDSCE
ncbi:hypothetical protein BHM03_00059038, partial [Ensete ventricosum]